MTSWTDYQDDISDAISESMDVDWSANDGARAVVRWLNENKPLTADTPRVTVPVDLISRALEELRMIRMKDSDAVYDTTQRLDLQLALSAAPAPEGGAVHYGDPCIKCGVGHDNVPPGPCRGDGITISRERATEILDYLKKGSGPAGWPTTLWCEVQAFIANIEAALATREEDPAEAGCGDEDAPQTLDLLCDFEDLVSTTPPLRAQPQAREDAKPVAWRWKTPIQHVGDGTRWGWTFASHPSTPPVSINPEPLYTHPAPDALRVVMRTAGFLLDRLRDLEWDVNERDFNGHVLPAASRLRQALAALQAEQKGGAA